jgi:hypothetical protein
MIMATHEEHFNTARKWQEHFDSKLSQVGMRAPEPVLGQTVNDYRRDVLLKAKRAFIPKTHQLRKFSLDDIRGDALNVIEQKILDAVVVEAQNPANVPRGEIREIVKTNINGHKVHEFVGQDHFTRFMGNAKRMALHDYRIKEWYPMSPETWRRRNDATRR